MTQLAGVPRPGGSRAAQMRLEFDAAFAQVPTRPADDLTDVLALRIGEARCLLRLADIVEVIAQPVLTSVPTSVPALLGITTGRGVPVAAYDLGLLLDQAPVVARWLLLPAAEPGVGIAAEHFEGYRQVALESARSYRLVEIETLLETIRQFRPNSRNITMENEK